MNISMNSWHFKFNKWMKSGSIHKIPTSLCPYFWTTVMHCAMVAVMVCFVSGVSWMFGIPIVTTWLIATFGLVSKLAITTIAIVIGFVAMVAFLSGLFGISYLIFTSIEKFKTYRENKKYDEIMERRRAGLPAQKEPNFVVAFIRARKEKYCPHLDFVKEEK